MLQNPCGGLRWEHLPDGLIAIEGEGVRSYEPRSVQFGQLEQTWRNWGSQIRRSARANGVPVSWVLAFATMETGAWSDDRAEQETIVSPAGAIGVMQIMPQTARGYGYEPAQMYDAATNISVAAELMADLARREDGQLPRIAARYNSGRLCDTTPCKKCNEWNLYADHNYPRKVIRWNNTALEHLELGGRGRMLAGVTFGLAGLGLAYAVLSGRLRV